LTQEEEDNRERSARNVGQRYPEWSPEEILEWRSATIANEAEFLRARWLWDRRPKRLLLPLFWRGVMLMGVPLTLLVVAALWPPSVTQDVIEGGAAGLLIIWGVESLTELYLWERWRADYSRAIARLFTRQD